MSKQTLRRLRETHHPRWTQAGLANACGLCRVTITRAETGGIPCDDVKRRIAKALGVKVSAIAWGEREAWA